MNPSGDLVLGSLGFQRSTFTLTKRDLLSPVQNSTCHTGTGISRIEGGPSVFSLRTLRGLSDPQAEAGTSNNYSVGKLHRHWQCECRSGERI